MSNTLPSNGPASFHPLTKNELEHSQRQRDALNKVIQDAKQRAANPQPEPQQKKIKNIFFCFKCFKKTDNIVECLEDRIGALPYTACGHCNSKKIMKLW